MQKFPSRACAETKEGLLPAGPEQGLPFLVVLLLLGRGHQHGLLLRVLLQGVLPAPSAAPIPAPASPERAP